MLKSDWYAERLRIRQTRDKQLWQRHFSYVQEFIDQPEYELDSVRLDLKTRLQYAEKELARVS